MKNAIDITGVDLKAFVRKVYELSIPQGYGFLHYQEGGLTDGEVDTLLAHGDDRIVVDMDYVKGRACKMVVFKENGKLFIHNAWYDHTDEQLRDLLLATLPKDKAFPIGDISREHSVSCNCGHCKVKR